MNVEELRRMLADDLQALRDGKSVLGVGEAISCRRWSNCQSEQPRASHSLSTIEVAVSSSHSEIHARSAVMKSSGGWLMRHRLNQAPLLFHYFSGRGTYVSGAWRRRPDTGPGQLTRFAGSGGFDGQQTRSLEGVHHGGVDGGQQEGR